jgi:DNA-binding GntR family transcriptional regulator
MIWTLQCVDQTKTPSREGKRTYETEAAFESAARDALADLRTKLVSATLPNGTVLDEAELRRRYAPR